MNGYVLLLPNAHRDLGLHASQQLAQHLEAHGHEVRIAPFLSDDIRHTWDKSIPTVNAAESVSGARLAVTLGGDGTILQASRYLSGTGIPVIGVNMGNKGFMTELESADLLRVLEAADGNYTTLERMMLDLELVRNGEVVYSGRALNEASVRALVSLVNVEAYGDGREITAFSGDGIIVSTPTGSTAYSMAAGGPIVEPNANCLIITPICAFRLAARSFVLTPDRFIQIRLPYQGEKQVMLSVDGVGIDFLDGDELRVRRSDKSLLMAKISDKSFYDMVFEKLNDKNY